MQEWVRDRPRPAPYNHLSEQFCKCGHYLRRCSMHRLWILVLWGSPLAFMVGGPGNVPANQVVVPAQQGKEASARQGDLYFVAIGQQDDWKFLPEGFEKAMRDQGKGLYRNIHGTV